jgi:hypothetical protein
MKWKEFAQSELRKVGEGGWCSDQDLEPRASEDEAKVLYTQRQLSVLEIM